VRDGGSRRLRRERAWPRAATTKEAARAIKDGGGGTLSGLGVWRPDGVSGRGRRAAVWESEWQWRIESANVLRMNGPNSGERVGLSECGLCTGTWTGVKVRARWK
jgi:hypothetical protein